MKPKHRVMCPECFKQKMLFETQKQADNFIKWNGDEIDTGGGELRSYYCPACGGYHITSKPYKPAYEHNTENLITRYEKDVLSDNVETIELPELSDIEKDILKNIPKDVRSKSKLRQYISEYYEANGVDDASVRCKTRKDIYKFINDGYFDVHMHIFCDKVISDEDLFEMVKDKSSEYKSLSYSVHSLVYKHHLVVTKGQFVRLIELAKKYNGDKYNANTDKVYNVYKKIIEETPELDKPQVKFIRHMVDSYLKVNNIDFNVDDVNKLKRLTTSYYNKKENEKKRID